MVLKELIFNSFYIWVGLVVLKELIFNSFYVGWVWYVFKELIFKFLHFGWVWLSWKDWFLTVSVFGSECMVVLKERIFNSFHFQGRVWWSWKNWLITVSTFEGCGGLERTDFITISTLGEGVVVLKELIFKSWYFEVRVWLSWKNWLINSFYIGRVWVVLKELIFKSWYFWGGCGCLERTDF